jgi:hypothetical protein
MVISIVVPRDLVSYAPWCLEMPNLAYPKALGMHGVQSTTRTRCKLLDGSSDLVMLFRKGHLEGV